MKITMLEPLGVSEEKVMEMAKPLVEKGHEFIYCGAPIATEEEKIAKAKGSDVYIIANSPLTEKLINASDNLKFISVGFTGVDHVDLNACKAKGIRVSNAQGYATDATAEATIALILACLRNIVPYDQIVRDGGTLHGYTNNTLKGKTIGIIGTGAIGCRVAEIANGFGVKLIGYSTTKREQALKLGIEYKTLKEVFEQSDIVTLHAPLTEATKNIASRDMIDSMKKTGILINCARGALVDSQALADALNEGRIAKAGIDVFEMEPPIPANHPLLNAKNVILTPHIGYFSQESFADRVKIVCNNIIAWMEGSPINIKL
ncbi:hydroxyacid dehydrogenase [Candidatus Epulonipiscium fishelsonii]|uniref:Hydroxyacid dehydrogenase n=1 Tax=Candidatus Epulonipiscium fishelsonii TaxID=77094 RepID=A0ACC8XDW9_9FIRM|nr:hydroxyacid dehydrogenase [Epulopiscium sp. SCG-B05WGA-EpuloA1]ONI41222.1 hydroxyacid dehydrogenase [Epulopiscium sp. SCG-B11WGA-EpuloA1]